MSLVSGHTIWPETAFKPGDIVAHKSAGTLAVVSGVVFYSSESYEYLVTIADDRNVSFAKEMELTTIESFKKWLKDNDIPNVMFNRITVSEE